MLIITKIRKIGAICGHTTYCIPESEKISIPNSTVRYKMACSKNENKASLFSIMNLNVRCP
jgi:hypothetical protein